MTSSRIFNWMKRKKKWVQSEPGVKWLCRTSSIYNIFHDMSQTIVLKLLGFSKKKFHTIKL